MRPRGAYNPPQCQRRRGALLVAVVALVAGIGCNRLHRDDQEPVEGEEVPTSLGAPRFVDTARGDFTTPEPLTLDFGRVRVHSEERREVLIRNTGRATFTVTGERTAEAVGGAFGFSSTPFSVAPNQQVALVVTFHPTTAGLVGGDAVLVIENGVPDALTLHLSGTGYHGESPEFELAPTQLDFGRVQAKRSQVRRITLANVGVDVLGTTTDNLRFGVVGEDGALIEKAPEITGPDAADFGVAGWPPPGYRSEGLSEGETVVLILRFTPTTGAAKSATLIIHSNDPRAPSTEVPLTGYAIPLTDCVLDVVPPGLNFGSVEANKYLTLHVALVNRNTDPSSECPIVHLDMSQTTRERGAFSLPDGPLEDVWISAGGQVVVPVRFAPMQSGQYTGDLVFTTSSLSSAASRSVPLSGIASSECLMIAPDEMDFGSVELECHSRQRLFTLYNTCSQRVFVTAIDMLAGPTSSAFQITYLPALPLTIVGGAQSQFGVTYSPLSASGGAETAAVAVAVSDRPDPLVVPLTGRGAPDSVQRDDFTDSPIPQLDVLFVLDNSASMADKQASVASNLASMANAGLARAIDVHIAVTTTDVSSSGEAGRLVPLVGTNPRVVTHFTPNAGQLFAQNAAVGTSGSDAESLLRPALLALSNPLMTGANAGFYRPLAKLSVVIVSDAADQDPLSTPVADYESFFASLKGPTRSRDVSVSAMIPTLTQAPAGCSYDTATAGSDTRVAQIVQSTGGQIADICDPQWASLFIGGTGGWVPRWTFWLSQVPDMTVTPDPIALTVDGQAYDACDSNGTPRWQYDASHNAVELLSEEIVWSLAGRTIEISYHVACH